ncbi:hypothetical protein BY996DRAFT_8394060 [Phakopsora pachyrhizi]|nr:hypothetical protein BY996DRAFT_8394060 [Phakopsora pachyrhizi]
MIDSRKFFLFFCLILILCLKNSAFIYTIKTRYGKNIVNTKQISSSKRLPYVIATQLLCP